MARNSILFLCLGVLGVYLFRAIMREERRRVAAELRQFSRLRRELEEFRSATPAAKETDHA